MYFQLLNFRDEEFDDETDRGRFAEIINLYRQILASKRIDALDMRIKSGWWGDHKNAYSAGKIKPQVYYEIFTMNKLVSLQIPGSNKNQSYTSGP